MYKNVIIGGGAAGLFCGANLENLDKEKEGTLLLEGTLVLGAKLMISGAGQCNFTHGGSIKDFLDKYGEKGKHIRKILYGFNNVKTMEFFQKNGIEIFQRKDGKVFPKSMKSREIRDFLVEKIERNNIEIKLGVKVISIGKNNGKFVIKDEKGQEYISENVVIATGGASYQKTGSDGNMLDVLKGSFPEIQIISIKESLVPLYIENYNFSNLSGISIKNVKIEKIDNENKNKNVSKGDILFTHKNLSGPAILNISRYVNRGDRLKINFLNGIEHKINFETQGVKKSFLNYMTELLELPKSFLQTILDNNFGEKYGSKSVESIGKKKIDEAINLLRNYRVTVSGNSGFDMAMATSGGIDLDDIDKSNMEHKNISGLYFAGEVIDVDGDTGGYNIQFAFSSGAAVAKNLSKKGLT